MYAFLILCGGGALLTAGDVLFKTWLQTKHPGFYACGIALYFAGLICLVESFKYQNIAAASAILVIANLVILSAVSYW